MSKKPALKHNYDQKNDRLKITLKRFSLGKKRLRTDVIDNLLQTLDKKSVRRKRGKRAKDPYKETRLPEVGD